MTDPASPAPAQDTPPAAADPATPATPAPPEPPRTPEAPKAPEAPPAPEAPKAPETPKEPEKPAPPEKYALKLPDGSRVQPAALERIAAFAKEQGLSNDEAQRLADHEHAVVEGLFEAHTERVKGWERDILADKEIGGENAPAVATRAQKLVARFGSPAFKAALDETGYGSHPEMVRFCNQIALAIGEDQLVIGGGANNGAPKTAEDVLFDNPTSRPQAQ